jgi:hypothetical protein
MDLLGDCTLRIRALNVLRCESQIRQADLHAPRAIGAVLIELFSRNHKFQSEQFVSIATTRVRGVSLQAEGIYGTLGEQEWKKYISDRPGLHPAEQPSSVPNSGEYTAK